MGYTHKTKTGKTTITTVDDENDFFEDATEFEETTFESDSSYQKDPQLFFTKPTPTPAPEPFRIDVDGDQIPELEVTFSRVNEQQMRATVKFLPNGQSQVLTFNYPAEFNVDHQDPSDGKKPYKFYFTTPDYTKVFYANESQWHTPTKEEIEAEKQWEQIKPGTDHLVPDKKVYYLLENYLNIQFQDNHPNYSYQIQYCTHEGVQASTVLTLSDHEFSTFKPETEPKKDHLPKRGIVRDTTDKTTTDLEAKDRSVASYTIPIEVGKIGAPGTKGDHNKHRYTITIQKSPEDNGLAAMSMSGWTGTRLIPIPGKFVDVKRPVVTEKANHLELFFEGKKYNTTLRIYQQYLMLKEKNRQGKKDEIFSLNVYADPLADNAKGVFSESKTYFGTQLITYKIKHINGAYLAYHNKSDSYTDEDEFHQAATTDARKKIGNQPSSSSTEEEFLNIFIKETQLIGAALAGQTLQDSRGKNVSGDQIFMDYLDMVIAIRRLSSFMKQTGDTKDVVTLAMIKDAQNKANRFWDTFGGFVLIGVDGLNYTVPRNHHSKTPSKPRVQTNVRMLPEYIGNRDWTRVKKVLLMYHKMLEGRVLHQKTKEVKELYDQKAKTIAEAMAKIEGRTASAADIAKARHRYERQEAQILKSVDGNFNLDTRYQKFLQEEKPTGEVYRAKALFYPEYLNVGEGKGAPTYIDLPLYYFQKDGYWHIVSLVNKQAGKLFKATEFAVQEGETHPPDEMFATLDRDDHLPKGLLYYETHDGYSSQIAITSHTPWWKYMGYIALAIFLLGLLVATGGASGIATASLAGELFFTAGVIGAAGAVGSMVDEYQRGTTTVKSFTVNLLDIAGAFIGAVKILKGPAMMKAANQVKAGVNPGFLSKIGIKELGGRYRYLMLEKIDLGVDATMVMIGTSDGFGQIIQVLSGPGTFDEKLSDVAAILPFVAMQGGIFVGTLRGRVKDIEGISKGRILDGLNLKSAKATNGSDIKSLENLNPKEFPAINKLKQSGDIFSKEAIEQVMGLVRRPRDLEPIARAIEKMDNKARLKALCARFSDKQVLYALYYFDGDFNKVHRHLVKNKTLFNDQGYNVYMNMKVYEDLKGGMKRADKRQKTLLENKVEKAKTTRDDLKTKYDDAVKKQESEQKHWDESQTKLKELQEAQAKTQQQLDDLPDKIRSLEKNLASNEAEAEGFGKLSQDKQLVDEQGISTWQKAQTKRVGKLNSNFTKLERKAESQASEIEQKDLQFANDQYNDSIKFYKKLNLERQNLSKSKDPSASQKLAELDKQEAEFIKQQDAKTKAFVLAQETRQTELDATQKLLAKQKAKVALENTQHNQYMKAAEAMKKAMALRKKIAQLHIERNNLLEAVQKTEKQIEKIRLELITKQGGKPSLERQIAELTASKNKQQALVVQKDMDIALLERQLAALAREENAYSLSITQTIQANNLDEKAVAALLQKNVAPQDLKQLKVFIEVQAKQVTSQKERQITASETFAAKEEEIVTINNTKEALLGEQDLLNKRLAQLQPTEPMPKGKRGQKRKPKGGGARKEQSKRDRRKNIEQKLEEIEQKFIKLDSELDAAINARDAAKAQQIEAKAKETQEAAKLEVYQEFYKLQHKISVGKESLETSQQEFMKLKGQLKTTSSELQRTDAAITNYRTPIKKAIDKRVDDLFDLKELANKDYERFNKSHRKLKLAHEQAKKHYDMLQRLNKEEYAKSLEEAKKAKKIVNLVYILITSGKAMVKQQAINFAVFKAWWKINKILKKLLNPDKNKAVKDLTQQEAYAIAEREKLERFLKNYVSESYSLPNDEASLWKLLFEVLEDTGKSNYPDNKWNELLTNLVGIKKDNERINGMKEGIATLKQQIRDYPIVSLSGEITPKESELLEKIDEIINEKQDQETKLTEKEINDILEFMNNMDEKKEEQ